MSYDAVLNLPRPSVFTRTFPLKSPAFIRPFIQTHWFPLRQSSVDGSRMLQPGSFRAMSVAWALTCQSAIQKGRRNPWKSCFLGKEVKFIVGGIPEPPNSQLTVRWFLLRGLISLSTCIQEIHVQGILWIASLKFSRSTWTPAAYSTSCASKHLPLTWKGTKISTFLCGKNMKKHGWKLLVNFQVPGRNVRGVVVKRSSHWMSLEDFCWGSTRQISSTTFYNFRECSIMIM